MLQGQKRVPCITLVMTDLDVVERAAIRWGTKVIHEDPRSVHYKPTFKVSIKGQRAVDWMLFLKPLLSARRQTKITSIVEISSRYEKKHFRLHDHEVAAIIIARLEGSPVTEIASRFGIRRESVYRIIRKHK